MTTNATGTPPPARPDLPAGEIGPAVLDIFERTGGLIRGHFRLTSGKHSDTYLQCAQVLQWPDVAERLGAALAAPWRDRVDAVVGPAVGGVIIGHEVARALGTRYLFTERVEGRMRFRRSFSLRPGERVLVVEDVVTTGGSALEAGAAAAEAGAEVVGYTAIVDRRPAPGGPVGGDGTPPLTALAWIEASAWEPEVCPRCAAGDPIDSPGSRRLAR